MDEIFLRDLTPVVEAANQRTQQLIEAIVPQIQIDWTMAALRLPAGLLQRVRLKRSQSRLGPSGSYRDTPGRGQLVRGLSPIPSVSAIV
jgi:hypothetical protein